jgi:hypothetical protein
MLHRTTGESSIYRKGTTKRNMGDRMEEKCMKKGKGDEEKE